MSMNIFEAGVAETATTREMNRLAQCRLCLSRERAPVLIKEGLPLVRCGGCGVVFADRSFSEEERKVHYAYYGRKKDDPAAVSLTQRRYGTLLNSFSSYRTKGRLLEVGCGRGYFLEVARAKGWRPVGTELSAEACDEARSKGLEVVLGSVSELSLAPGTFEVVVLFEVVEHMEKPLQEMRELFQLLRPGGLLYVTTPNFDSLTRRLLKGQWRIIQPQHRFYFTGTTLHFLLRTAGFERKALFSKNLSVGDWRLYWSWDRLRSPKTKSPKSLDETFRQKAARRRDLQLLQFGANLFFRYFHCGDTLEAYYKKPTGLKGVPA